MKRVGERGDSAENRQIFQPSLDRFRRERRAVSRYRIRTVYADECVPHANLSYQVKAALWASGTYLSRMARRG